MAKYLGGERTHWLPEDVRAGDFKVEVKHGKQIPKMLQRWWSQAQRNAEPDHLPLLVLHPERWRKEDSLVLLRISDLKEILDVGG